MIHDQVPFDLVIDRLFAMTVTLIQQYPGDWSSVAAKISLLQDALGASLVASV